SIFSETSQSNYPKKRKMNHHSNEDEYVCEIAKMMMIRQTVNILLPNTSSKLPACFGMFFL
ncbi:hypothetical protein S83_012597, partial [Arachis hypogaea]